MARLQVAISMLNGWIGNFTPLIGQDGRGATGRCRRLQSLLESSPDSGRTLLAVSLAPAAASFAIAVAAAVAWCLWLEKHPDRPSPERAGARSDLAAARRLLGVSHVILLVSASFAGAQTPPPAGEGGDDVSGPAAGGTAGADPAEPLAQREVRRHLRGLLPVQLEPPAGSQPRASRLRHARQHLRHPAGASSSTPRPTSRPAAATGCASICSSARPRRPCRAAPPTSRVRTSTATSGRPTAPICFRSAPTACRRTSASSGRSSATRPTMRRTTRRSRAPTCSTSCPSTTRVCVSPCR